MAPYARHLLMIAVLAVGNVVVGQDTGFFFDGFSLNDPHLQYSGDTLVTSDGQLNLTSFAANSVGHAVYLPAIKLLDSSTRTLASFSTNFTFRIQGGYGGGEGLAFFISNTSGNYGSGGAFLGVYGNDGAQVAKTVAVEFDTFQNGKEGIVEINDINANHVGLDLEVIRSKIQVDAGTVGIHLRDGSTISSWIDYAATTSTMEVRISLDSSARPVNPLISYKLDLSAILFGSEYVWIGFSAATGEYCLEYHTICDWGFSSWGLPPWYPPVPPPNSPPYSSTQAPAPTPWHGTPIPSPSSPPSYRTPSPLPPWHGNPVPSRAPPPTPTPSPWYHTISPTPPPFSPLTPPPWRGGPLPSPAPSPLSPSPTPSYGIGRSPPQQAPPSYPHGDHHYMIWIPPTVVGCALLLGLGLLVCWIRPHPKPPPPLPAPCSPPAPPTPCPPEEEEVEELIIIDVDETRC